MPGRGRNSGGMSGGARPGTGPKPKEGVTKKKPANKTPVRLGAFDKQTAPAAAKFPITGCMDKYLKKKEGDA